MRYLFKKIFKDRKMSVKEEAARQMDIRNAHESPSVNSFEKKWIFFYVC
jgi:hypothetical protein